MFERVQRAWRAFRAPAVAPAGRRGFAGAQNTRLTLSLPGYSNAINADLDTALTTLRARARHLCQNHEYGRRFLSMVATNLIGAYGPTLQVRAKNVPTKVGTVPSLDIPGNAAIEAHWARFGRSADLAGRSTLTQLLRVAVKAVARDGEAIVRKVTNRRAPYGLQLQLLEADRLDESINKLLANGNMIRQGVEIDSALRPVAYWLKTWHPGESYGGKLKIDVERVPANEIYHLFVPERAEQVRGYSWMHAVLMRAAMLQGYEEAAIIAARVGAAKMGIFTAGENADAVPKTDLGEEDPATGGISMSAEPGEFIDLTGHPGVDLKTWDPDYPHENFDSFVKTCLRGMASGLDVDYSTLSNDLEGVNYSSIRAGTIETREMWITLQEWLIDSFLLPLYRDWLEAALPLGAITFESGSRLSAERLGKFADAGTFQGRRWDWVDPLKDAQASQALIDARLASRRQIAAAQGRAIEDILDELAEEEALMKASGLEAAPQKPAAPAQPSDEDKAKADDLEERRVRAAERAAEAPRVVINNLPPQPTQVSVEAPQVRVEPTVINLPAPIVNVEAPQVNLEATIEPAEVRIEPGQAPIVNVSAPIVNVDVQPEIEVEATLRQQNSVTVHERNSAGDLIKSTTEYN
jgi:lambda family phage portal protein